MIHYKEVRSCHRGAPAPTPSICFGIGLTRSCAGPPGPTWRLTCVQRRPEVDFEAALPAFGPSGEDCAVSAAKHTGGGNHEDAH